MNYEQMMMESQGQYKGLGSGFTLKEFEYVLKTIDFNCKVHMHPTIPMCLQVLPSDNSYRDTLQQVADRHRPAGVLVSVARITWVDDFGPEWQAVKGVSTWNQITQYFKRKLNRAARSYQRRWKCGRL